MSTTRRDVLRSAVIAAVGTFPAFSSPEDVNTSLDAIVARIRRPTFPNRDFDITRYGAIGNGKEKCTEAIAKAIRECSAAGGGRIVIPEGAFLTGAIHLENNVNLYLSKGATLLFSRDPKDYLPNVFTRFEGTECMNYSPFVYAFEKQNIGVTGPGKLDGQAGPDHWWPWAGKSRGGWQKGQTSGLDDRKALVDMADRDVPVEKRIFGDGHFLRPNFVQPYRCRNVQLEDFTIVNSPMWELNPVLCTNVIVRGITINSHGPNNDGCDPECCRDVLISNVSFSTGDDCVAVKSGRNRDGRRVGVPCENVVIVDCEMKDGHGGVSIGSEVSGGIRNILTNHCHMSSPNLQRGLRIKSNSYRGGTIENIRFENVTIGQVAEATVEVDFYYEEGPGGPFKPVVRDIYIDHVTSQKSKYGIYLRGFPNDPINGVHISDCNFENAAKGNFFEAVAQVDVKNVDVNGKPVTLQEMLSTKAS
ncbi:MAG: glycoside hydrolase family 28 protein [Acidobacteriaceae bacterium]|nr:glycoside hydrolase family 28 protein [Acidobacteriaceae bacterium]